MASEPSTQAEDLQPTLGGSSLERSSSKASARQQSPQLENVPLPSSDTFPASSAPNFRHEGHPERADLENLDTAPVDPLRLLDERVRQADTPSPPPMLGPNPPLDVSTFGRWINRWHPNRAEARRQLKAFMERQEAATETTGAEFEAGQDETDNDAELGGADEDGEGDGDRGAEQGDRGMEELIEDMRELSTIIDLWHTDQGLCLRAKTWRALKKALLRRAKLLEVLLQSEEGRNDGGSETVQEQ